MERQVVELERLLSWKSALEQKLEELDAHVRPLLEEIEKTRHQLQLVGGLLGLESRGDGALAPASRSNQVGAPNGSVSDVLATIIQEAGGPLHISEIKGRFLGTGRTIPGKGTEANLISYIVRDPRFVRISKGTYSLDVFTTPSEVRSTRRKRTSRSQRKRW